MATPVKLTTEAQFLQVPVTPIATTATTTTTATSAAVVPKKGHGCCIMFFLFLLILLGLLFLLWWFLLRPWPMQGRWCEGIDRALGTTICTVPVDVEALKKQAALEQKALDDENLKALLDDHVKKALEEQKLAEKAQKEADELAKVKEFENVSLFDGKKPAVKCNTLKTTGKMPRMALAVDGSLSMTLDFGNTDRLSAAKKAGKQLVDKIDKNIMINFLEINGCPLPVNHGFFLGSAQERNRLKKAIGAIKPIDQDYISGTPLIPALRTIAESLDGVEYESLGIIISDGVDTCPQTRGQDVCEVARQVHKQKPKLKIHTIIIGDEDNPATYIANIIGGKVYKPQDTVELIKNMKEASGNFKKVCIE